MNVVSTGFLFALCIAVGSYATTVLKGEVTNKVFDHTGNPYLVDSTITIPKGGKVEFKEGCIVLINAFSGIEVKGNFIVKGTKKSPVIFTTVNDNRYNPESERFPEPLDWNGITLQLSSDTVFMENFSLQYSVYGIKSWNNRIVIHDGSFANNGQYDLVVNDQLQTVTPDVPYSYNYTADSNDTLTFQAKMLLYEQKVKKRKTLTLITSLIGIAGAGFDGFAWYKYIDYRTLYNMPRGADLSTKRELRDSWKQVAIIGAAGSGAVLLGALALYLLPVGDAPVAINEEQSRIMITPTFHQPGLVLSIPLW